MKHIALGDLEVSRIGLGAMGMSFGYTGSGSDDAIRRAHAVHPITAVQSEYSLWTRDPEDGLLTVLRELGIGFVAYSPLGRGFLTGRIRSTDAWDDSDWRRTSPRFVGQNFRCNLRIADEVQAVVAEVGATASPSSSRRCEGGRAPQ